jgi:glycosyltransferase involved in cell wall biosynthesis
VSAEEGGDLVTVVMPVRNESDFIGRSLEAVLVQDWPPERLEVIVADGMSTDGTRDTVERLVATHPNMRIVDNPAGIVAPGLNRAIEGADGEVVVRVDGHCEVAPDYVKRCLEALERNGMGEGKLLGVGGPIETAGETWIARAISAAMSSVFGVGGSAFRVGTECEREVDTVAFPAYPKATLDAVGPFDEELIRNQDDEYNFRLRAMGGRVVLCPEIRSVYYSRSTLISLWRQYFQYGFWKVRVMQKHPRQMQPRQYVPGLFVLALGLTLMASLIHPFFWVAFGLVAGTYLVANLSASIAVAVQRGLVMLPLLPFVFATLHLSYGIGFLWGLVRFARRWGDKTTLVNGERVMVGVKE